jgi:hypothetical protein
MPLYLPGIDYDQSFGPDIERYETGIHYNFIPDKFTVDQNGKLHLVVMREGGEKDVHHIKEDEPHIKKEDKPRIKKEDKPHIKKEDST